MKRKVEREIERISRYEKTLKIQTSEEKFKIIPIAQYKTKIRVNGKEIETSNGGKFLGLTYVLLASAATAASQRTKETQYS